MEGSTIVLLDNGQREVVGVIDVDGGLWVPGFPGSETHWNGGHDTGLRDYKVSTPPGLAGNQESGESQGIPDPYSQSCDLRMSTMSTPEFVQNLSPD